MSMSSRGGNAWKHRNGEPRTNRKMVRKAGFEAQWTVEQLWRNPSMEERRFMTDGLRVWEEWNPVAVKEHQLTGVRIFDEWVQYIAEGHLDMAAFCRRYDGLLTGDLNSLSFVLTGMGSIEFMFQYRLKTVDFLLRYTDLPNGEVARRSGFGSKNNLYLACKRAWGVAPMRRRQAVKKPGDVGRYRL